MKKKYIIVFIILLLVIILKIVNKSYAYETQSINEEKINLTIMFSDNLENDLYKYIDFIDNSLIPTANFTYSSQLIDNYEFFTIFAIKLILANPDYFKDEIYTLDKVKYNNFETNKYVNIETIYNITNSIFGKKDYIILNDYLKNYDRKIPLLLDDDYNCDMEIEKILNIEEENNLINVSVKYKNLDIIYIYEFINNNNQLLLKNLKVSW